MCGNTQTPDPAPDQPGIGITLHSWCPVHVLVSCFCCIAHDAHAEQESNFRTGTVLGLRSRYRCEEEWNPVPTQQQGMYY